MSKHYSAKFKLENSLSGTSQISKIESLASVLKCIKQRHTFFAHPVYRTDHNLISENLLLTSDRKFFDYFVFNDVFYFTVESNTPWYYIVSKN